MRCTYLFILVCSDSYECSLLEGVGVESVPPHSEDVISLNYVQTGLVLVHGVQDDLEGDRGVIR